jgi:hypothetical protein
MVMLMITGGQGHLDYAVEDLNGSGIACKVQRPDRGVNRMYRLAVPNERLTEVMETLSRYGVTFVQSRQVA